MLKRILRELVTGRAISGAGPAAGEAVSAQIAAAMQCYQHGDYRGAEAACRAVLDHAPQHPEASHLLGILAHVRGFDEHAVEHYTAAINASGANDSPRHALFLSNRGNSYLKLGEIDRAFEDFDRALALQPTLRLAHSNKLFALNFRAGVDPMTIHGSHVLWGRTFADPYTPMSKAFGNDRDPGRRLRVGYVSPDFRRHAVSYFFEPLLEHHDPERFEILLYSCRPYEDACTVRLRARAHGFRELSGADDRTAARMIEDDGIDVLIDLAGHTSENRLPVFAYRPAPVQITYLGYPATTGMRAMDYRISDALADPPGMTERHYLEEILRLERCLWCYRPPSDCADPGPLPALANGFVTFGSFNGVIKLSPECLALWARVLHAVPDSRLLIAPVESWDARLRIGEALEAQGIDTARVQFVGRLEQDRFMALRREVDIGLDSTPCHGGTTTCETLWMGVPVVSLIGASFPSRAGATLLDAVDLGTLATPDADAYVAAAAALASDTTGLAAMREGMRTRIGRSPLRDEAGFTHGMERLYREAWQAWCAQARPGASREAA